MISRSPLENTHAANLIGGEWVSTSPVFESVSPADTSVIVGTAPRSTPEMVDVAVQKASEAFRTWREESWIQRGEAIDRLAQLMKPRVERLATLVTRECGKPYAEAKAEVVEALHMAQYVAGLSRMPIGHVLSSELPEKDAFILRKPKGVVAVITPWNFPMAVPLWGILPSLLAGNTIVFKPSEETPICGHELMLLFEEAGFPSGVLNIVHGFGEDVGEALVRHPKTSVVLFTGSRAVGTHIQRVAANETCKFVATEMGGKNAVLVLDDADLSLAVNASILSAFRTSGQRCVSSGRLIVDRKVESKFTDAFLDVVKRLKVGDGLDPDTFVGPLVNRAGVEKWRHHNAMAESEGAEVLFRGGEPTTGSIERGHFVEPFVYRFEGYRPNTFCLREEAFSPHVAIIPVDDVQEAVRVYNDTEYGLSMAVITQDYRKWHYVRQHAEFGLGYVNLPSIGAEVHLPFGGVKGSGNGHPAAEGILESVTHRVAFTVNHGEQIRMAQGLTAHID